jgi:NodT family efflux transporter outer membrane factor (OMF) lipoprotein
MNRLFACLLLAVAVVVVVVVGIAGCTVGPDYQAPNRPMPRGWVGPSTQPATQASVTVDAAADVATWWRNFNDPALDSLIDRAIAQNLDLALASSRLRQARAARTIAVAGLWPRADASASYDRAGTLNGDSHSLFRAGLDATWELDIFGGVRRSVEAANADISSAQEDIRDVLVTLTSEVALNYLDLRGFQRQIVIAEQNLATQLDTAGLVQRRREAGFIRRLDVANAEAQVAATRSQIPRLEQSERQTIYNIALLLGLEPGALVAELEQEAPIPVAPAEVPVGLPSDLLRRRPDIRRAESNLHGATARVGVATADLFPRFNLTGSVASAGSTFKSLGNASNAAWTIGPGISWPIFTAGSIRANIRVQTEAQEQSAISYEQSVLNALRDVESSLVAYAREQQRRVSLREAVDANRVRVKLAQELFAGGQTDSLNVLDAQRSLFAAEDALVQSDTTVAQNLVSLYKALGGGWEAVAPENTPATQPSSARASRTP